VEEEWSRQSGGPATVPDEEIARLAAHFPAPSYDVLAGDDPTYKSELADNRAFSNWAKRNVHSHKVAGYAIVTLSLKKTGVPPGDVTSNQMKAIADHAENYRFGQRRVSHEQNL